MSEIEGQIMMGDVAAMIEEHGRRQYQAFVDKFTPAKTTDDCYTPPLVMNAVNTWVASTYGVDPETFVRPFFPGGDYEHHEYPPGCTVVDNPPFSILAQIIRFYVARGIRFFLFAPTLTLFGYLREANRGKLCVIPCGVGITYENGAEVNTSFVTYLETNAAVHTRPDLYKAVEDANDQNKKEKRKELPKYSYPDCVMTSAASARLCKFGQELRFAWDDCRHIGGLEAQKETGKSIFGGGLLLSEHATAERAAAELAAGVRAMDERATSWRLSPREMEMQKRLGGAK